MTEPLLCRSMGFSLPELPQTPPVVVSTYADDIHVFIQDRNDVQELKESLDLYEEAFLANSRLSSATLGSKFIEAGITGASLEPLGNITNIESPAVLRRMVLELTNGMTTVSRFFSSRGVSPESRGCINGPREEAAL